MMPIRTALINYPGSVDKFLLGSVPKLRRIKAPRRARKLIMSHPVQRVHTGSTEPFKDPATVSSFREPEHGQNKCLHTYNT